MNKIKPLPLTLGIILLLICYTYYSLKEAVNKSLPSDFNIQLYSIKDSLPDSLFRQLVSIVHKRYTSDIITIDNVYPLSLNSLQWLCTVRTSSELATDYVVISTADTVLLNITSLSDPFFGIYLFADENGKKFLAIGSLDRPTGKYAYIEIFEITVDESLVRCNNQEIALKIRVEFQIYGSSEIP